MSNITGIIRSLSASGIVQIGDTPTGPTMTVNADGSIDVNIISSSTAQIQTVTLTYNQVTSVPSGVETTVTTYTAPIGKISYLQFITSGGTNIAEQRVYHNASIFDKKYTEFTLLSIDFDYRPGAATGTFGFLIPPTDTITIKVLHNRPNLGTFNARIQVLEIG